MLSLVFLAVYFAALFSPALLDDADATHAQAAQHIVTSGDWVTMYVNGIRYLEKPPLPYWMVAVDYHLFGFNVFATHLPMALAVLGCAWIAWLWSRRAWGDRAAFYAALAILTSVGTFLFTRTLIPESILTFFLILALYSFLLGVEDRKPSRFYVAYASVAIALLAKGLIAPVFFVAAVVVYLAVTGEWRRWREFRLFTGLLLFLAIGAPWHILAGLRNPDYGNPHGNVPSPGHVHGFFYFYFINEHFLRFLGTRYPHDYNRQPWWVFWFGQLIWLFPWSLFLPAVLRRAWRNRHLFASDLRYEATNTIHFLDPKLTAWESSALAAQLRFRARTGLLLTIYAVFILVFFALSTNQEYYTWPIYPAVLMLIAGSLATVEQAPADRRRDSSAWITGAHVFFALLGMLAAALLAYGLWQSRHLPYIDDIGTLMAHRGVGNYTLSMSHFFDLTGPSFAALRLPAVLAAAAFFFGPLAAWRLRRRGHALESTVSVAFTLAVILIAAHIAFVRFQPMLSSKAMANTINRAHRRSGERRRSADALRRSVRRLVDHLLHAAPGAAGARAHLVLPARKGRRPGEALRIVDDLGLRLPRRPAHLPQRYRPAAHVGNGPAQVPFRPRSVSPACGEAAGIAPDRSAGGFRQDPLHRPPALMPCVIQPQCSSLIFVPSGIFSSN